MNLFAAYLMLTGSLAATAQVARGFVRAAGRLAQGDPKGAFVEAAGGVIAPATSAANQICRLGSEVFLVASQLITEDQAQISGPWLRTEDSPNAAGF